MGLCATLVLFFSLTWQTSFAADYFAAAARGPQGKAPAAEDTAQAALDIYADFLAKLSKNDLNAGNCVNNARAFAEILAASPRADKSAVRVVLLVREPGEYYMPQPIRPNFNYLKGEAPPFWIWHAFAVYDGIVFDPNYSPGPAPLAAYYKNFWSSDPNSAAFWLFPVKPEDVPLLTGSPYPGAKPRMLSWQPVNFAYLTQHPLHLSKPRR